MTIGINATLRMVAQFSISTVSKAQNVYHFHHLSTEDKTDEQVVVAMSEYIVDLMGNLTARISSSFDLQKIECYVLNLLAWEPIGVATPTWGGANINERIPSGIALMVKAYKERSGYADKKFLGGWTEENIAGDAFQAAATDAAVNYAAAWIASYTGTDAVVLLPVSFRAIDGFTRPYTSTEVATLASYQRRRKPGVGLT